MTAPDWVALGLREFVRPHAEGTTIAELIRDWQASPEWAALAPNTRICYGSALRRMSDLFGQVRPAEWEAAWGQHYMAERRGAPVAANMDMQCLSGVFRRAVQAGLIPANPVRDVRFHSQSPRTRYVTDAEVSAFRAHCDERMAAYLDLKLATGIRQGQIIALRWRQWNGHELFVPGVKGGNDTTYWGPGVADALTRCASAYYGVTPAALVPESAVICTSRGLPFGAARHWADRWRAVMKRFVADGGTHFREHDLRAKVASDSSDLTLAQERLGHQTSKVTQRVYMRKPRHVRSADIRSRQPDLFEMGGPAASLKESGEAASEAAPAARRPRRPMRPRSEPAAGHSAGSPAKSPSPPRRAERRPPPPRTETPEGARAAT